MDVEKVMQEFNEKHLIGRDIKNRVEIYDFVKQKLEKQMKEIIKKIEGMEIVKHEKVAGANIDNHVEHYVIGYNEAIEDIITKLK